MNEIETLIARLRAALAGPDDGFRSGETAPPPPPDGDAPPRELFRAAWTAAGGIAVVAPSPEAALPALAGILLSAEVKGLFAPEDDGPARDLALSLVPFGPFSLLHADDLRNADPSGAAGLQTAEFAIAETGTLVQTGRGGRTLLPGLLADAHVALVPAERLRARMEEVLAELSDHMPRNVSFMTGPSRTGDIEQTLVIGAHGPRTAVAVLLP